MFYALSYCTVYRTVNGVQLRKEIEKIFRRDSGKLRCEVLILAEGVRE